MEPFAFAEGLLTLHHFTVGGCPAIAVFGFGAVILPFFVAGVVLLELLQLVLLLLLLQSVLSLLTIILWQSGLFLLTL